MLFACIYVEDFSVQAVVRTEEAGLREQAVAVVDGRPPLMTVAAANARARAAGVVAGMTRLHAEHCPGVRLRPRSPAQEQSAHAALLDCAHAFSPRVEATSADTVILDMEGLEPLFGPPASAARQLAQRLAAMNLEANIAVAANPDAAMHAARGFAGITVLDAAHTAERLGMLPVDVLAVAPEVLETLDRWGVRNLRGLAALPPLALCERLGQEGLRLQRLARGEHSRPLAPAAEPCEFVEAMELEDAVELLEPLSFLLARLLEQLCARLESRSLAANELRLRLEMEVHLDVQIDGQTNDDGDDTQERGVHARDIHEQNIHARDVHEQNIHERTLRLPVPMLDAKVFLKLLQLDLREHPPAWPVRKIMLQARPERPQVTQSGLFVPAAPEMTRLEVTLGRIRHIVIGKGGNSGNRASAANKSGGAGNARVGSPQLLDTHRRDAFLMQRFFPPAPSAAGEVGLPAHTHMAALRLFRPALPVEVELNAGAPRRVVMRRQSAPVAAAAGPWRSSGEWWTAEAWTREEWDVAVAWEEGATGVTLYRLYRDLASGQWFAEGSYD